MQIMEENKYLKKEVEKQKNAYLSDKRCTLLTSRFNNKTLNENRNYKNKKKLGCIYCSPCPISVNIPSESIMFILEMNNDKNMIEGIGMVRNKAYVNKYNVYEDGNYNRYVFIGNNFIDRKAMNENEELVMKAFDILCFKGNNHMKRGQGLKQFPTRLLFNASKKIDLVDFIKDMFKGRMTK
tara:strand:+ start:655 stop:1200 length:546 start_codon:yes stop_codon:yes gene_type:complete